MSEAPESLGPSPTGAPVRWLREPGNGFSPEGDPAGAWTVTSPASSTVRNAFLLFVSYPATVLCTAAGMD